MVVVGIVAIFPLPILLLHARPDGLQRAELAQFLGRFHPLAVHIPIALLLLVPARAQEGTQQPGTQQPGAQHPGRNVVMSKCFQCHTDAMFRDQRQDRRGWEAAIHRMIGRGGLWSSEEIKLMADYLSSDFGPNSKPITPSR